MSETDSTHSPSTSPSVNIFFRENDTDICVFPARNALMACHNTIPTLNFLVLANTKYDRGGDLFLVICETYCLILGCDKGVRGTKSFCRWKRKSLIGLILLNLAFWSGFYGANDGRDNTNTPTMQFLFIHERLSSYRKKQPPSDPRLSIHIQIAQLVMLWLVSLVFDSQSKFSWSEQDNRQKLPTW